MGPSTYGLDDDFDVVLRDDHDRAIESKRLSYTAGRKFCFEGRHDGDYRIAIVLHKNGSLQPAVVYPTNYKQRSAKSCNAIYMVEPACPK